MCQKRNTKKNLNQLNHRLDDNKKEETPLRNEEDIYLQIQQLYDECDFENCLQTINKVLSGIASNESTIHSTKENLSAVNISSQPVPFFSTGPKKNTLPLQLEDIIVKKGYCLFRLKQYQTLENKILNRYSYLPRIQRLRLQYLFETKNFYKVLEILPRNTSNNTDHQKMRVDSLFELNRYQECLEALRSLEFHMKRCTRLSYIKATCLKNTNQINEYITLAIKLIEEERLNSNFIRKLLKGVLNTYMQDSTLSLQNMQNYCALFLRNHAKYLKNANKYEKYHIMYDTLIQKLKIERNLPSDNDSLVQGHYQKHVTVDSPMKCYICLGEFPVAFSLCKNYCEYICISCIQSVSVQCVKCMICKTPYL